MRKPNLGMSHTQRNMQQTHPAVPYPLPAQPFHHCIQTVVRLSHSGADAGGGLSTVQLLLQFNNLTFKRLVLLLKTVGLKGAEIDRYVLCIYTERFTASRHDTAEGKQSAVTGFVLTSSMSLTRRSLRAAMTLRSWTNRFRPSLLSALAATKSNLSQSHSQVAAPLRGHKVPKTGLDFKGSQRRSFDPPSRTKSGFQHFLKYHNQAKFPQIQGHNG